MKEKLFYLFTLIAIALTITACHIDFTKEEERPSSTPENPQPVEEDNSDDTDQTGNTESSENIPVIKKIPQYFWGIWQRMDNGQYYTINEDCIVFKNHIYSLKAVNNESITVDNLGTLKKQSDSVMVNGAIPYFRNGGTNLSYTMKLVGFTDSSTRSADNTSFADYTITGKSSSYASFISTAKANDEGTVTLNAPVSGDRQTVFVTNGDSTIAVVPGVMVETNGSNMGTIPISKTGEYSLKVTGTIPEDEKDNGYLYGNNYKSYPMTLTITNISDVTSAPSICTIEAADPRISVSAANGEDIEGGVIISTLKPSFYKTINLNITCDIIDEAYIDSGLVISITNAMTERKWNDFVPLRFFKGLSPITIAAENLEKNTNSSLNGFLIFPDGNSQFFSIPAGAFRSIYVPTFRNEDLFHLAFSGATITGELSNSTEMLYTVSFGNWTMKEIDKSTAAFINSVRYGEDGDKNETEDTSQIPEQEFEAYLSEGDIDFYKFKLHDAPSVTPDKVKYSKIVYKTELSAAPLEVTIPTGAELSSVYLPTLTDPSYIFEGWFIDDEKITEGFQIIRDITLTAKWSPKTFHIYYELNGGTNNDTNPISFVFSENIDDKLILNGATKNESVFEGWYNTPDFKGNCLTEISRNTSNDIILYAKWECLKYRITTDEISTIDLSKNKNPVSLIISGVIKEDTMFLITKQISKANNNVTLDMSQVTGVYKSNDMPLQSSFNNEPYNLQKCIYFKKLILPKCLKELTFFACGGCEYLEEIVLPEGITTIPHSAFAESLNLKKIIIPDSVLRIETDAFTKCKSLSTITIPANVSYIGYRVFSYCNNLTSIIFEDPSSWYALFQGNDKVYYSVDDPEKNVSYFKSSNCDWHKE